MNFSDLPTLNAVLNAVSVTFLTLGYINIRRKRDALHKRFMLCAFGSSFVFFVSYLVYHYKVGSVMYPYHDWSRVLYFIVLVPHVILAALMVPFILYILYHGLRGNFEKHRRVARFTWPVWMFVSITGIIVYLMLYVI